MTKKKVQYDCHLLAQTPNGQPVLPEVADEGTLASIRKNRLFRPHV
jgi:hypothetical protein